MWSMSTSDAAVQVAPSYGLYQLPEVAAQAELATTLVPSRLRTVSRVLQAPLIGDPVREQIAVVGGGVRRGGHGERRRAGSSRPRSVGMPGGVAYAGAPKPNWTKVASRAAASTAGIVRRDDFK